MTDIPDSDLRDVINQNTAALSAATKALSTVQPLFTKESRRRGWALVGLSVAVVLLIGAVVLQGINNAAYRRQRCESANDSREAIRHGFGTLEDFVAPDPSPLQRQRIADLNGRLEKALPTSKC
jgi:low affinity Fe/Cu permease